jgi:F-type H+-transporting ATPase subunit b
MGSLIDFKQVLTQIVGFLIFLWLMRKYAWAPLLATLEARREKIAADLDEAEATKRQAAELRADLDRQLKVIEQQARTRIQEAVNEGQEVAAQIKADAQAQARARLERADAEIETERAKAQKGLQEQLAVLAVTGAEKILRKKMDDAEHRRLVSEFIVEVKEIGK